MVGSGQSGDRVDADMSAQARRSERESSGHGGDCGREAKHCILEGDVELLDLAVNSLDGLVEATGAGSGREHSGDLDVAGLVPEVISSAKVFVLQQSSNTEGVCASIGIVGDVWRFGVPCNYFVFSCEIQGVDDFGRRQEVGVYCPGRRRVGERHASCVVCGVAHADADIVTISNGRRSPGVVYV